MERQRIIFAGAGEFGLPTLRAIIDAGHDVVRVYSQVDRPAGRGRKLTPTPIAQFGLDNGMDVVRTADINAESLPPADLLVVIAFGQKIAESVTTHPRLGAVNLHSSRLPKYRGAAPINWAILAGETTTGNSIIRLAQRMDAGAILGQSELAIGELETAGELHDRLAADGAPLMLRVIEEQAGGRATETAQDESKATRALKLSREATAIDWAKPAEVLARHVRGMYPWPGCRVSLRDGAGAELNRVTLVRARAVSGSGEAGGITTSGAIGTGEGLLEVVEVQPEGKRAMALSAYQNGHKWEAGMRVVSIV
ncbi:MAG: methionyl-tRNA formyltransferase [Phycisphaerae bacterium]|nr:methionyl-tRNA formyltransferase [Tepidisphaeraceae bacterium]